MPIVSLFEHQKLTAAICNCLKSGNKFIVLRYKLKNIGNFIYQDFESIKTKSLLVQLIQEYIAFFFINYFNLTYENLIYSLGGEGRLLLPYCKKNKLSKLANIIVNLVNSIFNGIINIVLTYDIYNEKTLIYNYFKNEKILKIKKQKINHNIDINQLLLDSILKNEKFIIEYNFTNSKENAIVDLGRFGSINLYSKINEKSYYASYNNYLLGEVKYYPILNNLKTKENLVFVLMDIDNLENIIKTKKLSRRLRNIVL
ncbi:MAG TPA: hypothetical protein GXZ48_00105, partial [Acholeplasmataceae bacterium]|nr:hypothetical protein [Acholeplasmataceae bacterium]